MTTTTTTLDTTALAKGGGQSAPPPPKSYWAESWERLRQNRVGILAGSVILTFGVIGLVAPLISMYVTHYDPNRQVLLDQFEGISARHLLGTDELGRDLLTRLIYGARVSYLIGFLTVALSLTIGSTVGIVAGFYGGLVDRVLGRAVDMLLAVPTFYLLVLIAATHPFGLTTNQPVPLAVVLALLGWGGTSRLVRGEVLSVKQRDFILATRSVGASGLRIMFRHVLPNVAAVMIIVASLGVGGVILAEAGLDFIGLGIVPPTPTWGNMLNNAQSYFYHSTLLVLAPGLMIFVAVLCFNLFGNAIRDALDPRLR
jgi:peptide/nickel transport system permease protein